MADYYPLIARAVEGLSDSAPETRRAVYERARTALTAQLRTIDPPLSEAQIHQESLALDAAIKRVEAEFVPQPAPSIKSIFALQPAAADEPEAPTPAPSSGLPGSEAEAIARPRIESRRHPAMQGDKRTRTIILGAVLASVIVVIAAVAFLWRDKPQDLTPTPPVAEAPQPQKPEANKSAERVGGPAAPAAQNSRQEVGVAQRAVFYEEDPANPQAPKAQVGRVVWRLEDINPGQGQPLEKAVRATVEIPDAGMTMKLTLRRNVDTTLPASHTVELIFTTKNGDSGRVIRDIGLLQFKNEEAARGTPVAGLPVPVRENLFLIGLSNLASDIDRNTELFVRRNWIDLPVRMASGQRAILSFEKGTSGDQIMTSAFSQWQ
ncbi:histidine kinase [Microvirga terricola]|uniref:Histidine kinase n=1 Tax=Microvirga terricola TaxID=2719797 RepID=A0ABX0VE07_9HYPH|nr:histidine kinase [Microvirga terricola]NIX77887.1 histidine kinase [Microvirga terricola]